MSVQEVLKALQGLCVPKDQKNEFGGFTFRSAEDILRVATPILREHDALLILTDDIVQMGDRFYVKATAKLIKEDQEISNTAYAREPELVKKQAEAMTTGASSSYARKYAMSGLFLVGQEKDPDSTHKFGKDKKEKKTKKEEKPEIKGWTKNELFQVVNEFQNFAQFEEFDKAEHANIVADLGDQAEFFFKWFKEQQEKIDVPQ